MFDFQTYLNQILIKCTKRVTTQCVMEQHIAHQVLGDVTLVDNAGNQARLSPYDVVLFYFSAHWCPPCREFTPMLKSFYERLPKGSVRIVFVSRDRSKEEFTSYFHKEHGNWLAINFDSQISDIAKR